MKNAVTKKPPSRKAGPEMRAEYDFSGGVRGRYSAKYQQGTNVVLLDPDLARAFPESKAVNEALRALLALATGVETGRSTRTRY